MTETNVTTTVNHPRLREALEKARPEMTVIERDELLPVNLDPLAAASTARGALPQIVQYRVQLAALPGFDIKWLDNLETYAMAATQTQTVFQGASLPPEQFNELVSEATGLRETLLSDATALANRGFVSNAKLGLLKGSHGFRNIASDVLTLANMIRGNWKNVAGKTGVTEAELDRAEIIGDQLINDIGVREQAPTTMAAESLERQQAYTLLVRAYDQLRRGLTYLRWDEGDADDIAPSLYGGRRRKSGTDIEKPVTEPTTTTTTTTTPTNGTTTVPNGGQGSTVTLPTGVKPAIGMPGSDPFVQ
ncbi:MAG TPA: hypothetical protein VIV60_11935 [Polyangiaceae bacterium]